MKIKRIVIGSSNPGKINEWKFLLEDTINCVSVSDLGIEKSPEETGKDFLENAIQKAKYYSSLVNEFVFSEDGGFEVDYLNGLPGVKSRRILPGNKDGTDQELIDFILNKLKGVPKSKRKARLTSKMVLCDHKGKIIFQDEGSMEGYVPFKPSKKLIEGYPYRSILFLPQVNKYYCELTEKEHKRLAHKKVVAERLSKFLLKYK